MIAEVNILIIDDELYGRENLAFYVNKYFNGLVTIHKVGDIKEAQQILNSKKIDIIFLDIRLERESGFNLLDLYPDRQFITIIVSGDNQHGILALKYGVVDYILKPYSEKELFEALNKALKLIKEEGKTEAKRSEYPQKLRINILSGFYIFDVDDIIRLESESNYTKIFLKTGENYITSKTLKLFLPYLDPSKFFRPHRSHVINISYIKGYNSNDGSFIVMSDGSMIELSRKQQKNFFDLLLKLSTKII